MYLSRVTRKGKHNRAMTPSWTVAASTWDGRGSFPFALLPLLSGIGHPRGMGAHSVCVLMKS